MEKWIKENKFLCFLIFLAIVLSINLICAYPTKSTPPYPTGNLQLYPTNDIEYPQLEENKDGSPYPTNKVEYPQLEGNKDGSPYPTKNNSYPSDEVNEESEILKFFWSIKNFFSNLFR